MGERMKLSTALVSLSLTGALFLGGCQTCTSYPNYPAQRAFCEEQSHCQAPIFNRMDEASREDLVIDLSQTCLPQWRRRAYESVEQWLERIESELHEKQFQINEMEVSLQGLEEKERELARKVQLYRKGNAELRSKISPPQEETLAFSASSQPQLAPPPFLIHLVKKGETLFSISMDHYGTGKKIPELMQWNQGWVRYPEDILAGMALVLFHEGAQDTSPYVVDRYLEEVETAR